MATATAFNVLGDGVAEASIAGQSTKMTSEINEAPENNLAPEANDPTPDIPESPVVPAAPDSDLSEPDSPEANSPDVGEPEANPGAAAEEVPDVLAAKRGWRGVHRVSWAAGLIATVPVLSAVAAPTHESDVPLAPLAATPETPNDRAGVMSPGPAVTTSATPVDPTHAASPSDAPKASETPSIVPPSAPVRTTMAEERWITRYRPRRNIVEIGVAVGAFFTSRVHELYDYNQTWRPYAPAAASLAARLGYYPLGLLGLEAEAGLAPTRTDVDDRARIFGVRGHVVVQLPLSSIVPFTLVGGGLLGAGGALGRDTDPSLHFGGGLKIYASRFVGVRLDARAHLGFARTAEAYHTFHPEVLASLVVTLARPYLDTDRDGVPDPGQRARSEDACPREPGKRSLRGCPDRDGDDLRDADDRCPDQAGLRERDGCPALVDGDGDGFFDPDQYKIPDGLTDGCPREVGAKEYAGCRAPDTDGDGLDDLADRCPKQPETSNGFEDSDGCADKLPLDVVKIIGTIRGIQFSYASARLTDSSRPILEQTARILAEYPELKLEIQGHTDTTGDPEFNKQLSGDRAESVRLALIEFGVAADRLRAEGHGGERPLADNTTEVGRVANRRIEFILLDAEGRPLAVDANKPR